MSLNLPDTVGVSSDITELAALREKVITKVLQLEAAIRNKEEFMERVIRKRNETDSQATRAQAEIAVLEKDLNPSPEVNSKLEAKRALVKEAGTLLNKFDQDMARFQRQHKENIEHLQSARKLHASITQKIMELKKLIE